MIHLIEAANRHLYRAELAELHRERRRQFVDGRGWPLQVRDGGEYDAYDDEAARHLIAFAPDGALEAACRLRPTQRGGLIPDVFPHLLAPSEPSAETAGTWECTRYFSTRPGRGGFEGRSKLHVAMVEHVRDEGGDRLLGFVDLPYLAHLRRFSGLRIRPVGLPADYGDGEAGGTTIAFEIGVTPADLEDTRRRLRLPARQLFVAPAWLPEGTDVLTLERSARVLLCGPEAARRDLMDRTVFLAGSVARPSEMEAALAELGSAA